MRFKKPLILSVIGGVLDGALYFKEELPWIPFKIKNAIVKPWKNPYQTEEDLKSDFNLERSKLGLEGVVIKLTLDENASKNLYDTRSSGNGIVVYRNKNGELLYEVILGAFKTRRALRHELYHIYEIEKKIVPIQTNDFQEWLAEWRAVFYANKKKLNN